MKRWTGMLLAQMYVELGNELQDVCEEIAAEINRGNTELALLMFRRDTAREIGKRVPGPEGTKAVQAVVTFVGARFGLSSDLVQ
jgi:hypothetical protein